MTLYRETRETANRVVGDGDGDGDGDGKAFLLGCAVREREHLDTHCHAMPFHRAMLNQPGMAVGAVQCRISSWTEGSGTTMLQHGAEAGTGTFHQKQQ